MSVAVIIPALNEEATVGALVARIPRSVAREIIVVDNGSQDRTAEVAAAAGATVVVEPVPGYGAACLAGARAARSDILVFMDGDGSFDPTDIPRLVDPFNHHRANLVLGSRTLGESAAILPHQRFGNWLAVELMSLLFGMAVTDLGPFRAIRRGALLRLNMTEMTYGWPIEMMILAHRAGMRLVEVPVSYGPRLGGQSKVSGTLKGSVKAGYHILKTVVRCAWRTRSIKRPTGGSHV